MSSVTHRLDIPSVDNVEREWGDRTYPIWLLLNPKHPSVRHNIWTPVLAEVQDKIYREIQNRIDTSQIYIRNVISDGSIVPNTLNWWGSEVSKEIELCREIVLEYKPKIIISFGAFPYEFIRRVNKMKPEKGPKAWGNSNLEDEFQRSIENFDINKTNKIPLLRRMFVSSKIVRDQANYVRPDIENYFRYTGTKIAEKIIEHKASFNIWI